MNKLESTVSAATAFTLNSKAFLTEQEFAWNGMEATYPGKPSHAVCQWYGATFAIDQANTFLDNVRRGVYRIFGVDARNMRITFLKEEYPGGLTSIRMSLVGRIVNGTDDGTKVFARAQVVYGNDRVVTDFAERKCELWDLYNQ